MAVCGEVLWCGVAGLLSLVVFVGWGLLGQVGYGRGKSLEGCVPLVV